jgi:hypothetical protein
MRQPDTVALFGMRLPGGELPNDSRQRWWKIDKPKRSR